jgi:hypothetical protein
VGAGADAGGRVVVVVVVVVVVLEADLSEAEDHQRRATWNHATGVLAHVSPETEVNGVTDDR